MAISYQRLRKEGYAPWDREGRFYLIHGKVGNTCEMHEQIDLMPVNVQESKSLDEIEAQRGETASMAQDTAAQERRERATADLLNIDQERPAPIINHQSCSRPC